RPQMIKHVWLEHGLLMDGQSVREPWRLIEDWVEDYSLDRNPELLARCRALARRIDPREGLLRVHRLFLEKRVSDKGAVASVLEAVESALSRRSALAGVLLLLSAALVLTAVARLVWAPRRERLDRLVDYAWALLVPRMHADGFVVEDSHFLARLGLTSLGRGR